MDSLESHLYWQWREQIKHINIEETELIFMIFTYPDLNRPIYNLLNPFAQCGFPLPNCTAYAWGRVQECCRHRIELLPMGDAKDWLDNAKSLGIPTGVYPAVGSIVVFDCGEDGHVAVVEEINDYNEMYISQSHWNGIELDFEWIRTDGTGKYGNILGYIYPFDLKEFFNDYITATYLEILGRLPDSKGLENYIEMLENSNTLNVVDNSLINSQEFRDKFITRCYNNLLSRNPDYSGLEYYREFETLTEIIYDIKHSQEYIDKHK